MGTSVDSKHRIMRNVHHNNQSLKRHLHSVCLVQSRFKLLLLSCVKEILFPVEYPHSLREDACVESA